jgi:hypothetical protein
MGYGSVDKNRAAGALALFLCLAAAGAQPPIDFSYAGYGGGGVSLPTVPAARFLSTEP